jgi:hypothetical protein
MGLEKGEEIVLDNGRLTSSYWKEYSLSVKRRLTLTNRRLIIQKGGGLIKVNWTKELEIPLEAIEEARIVNHPVFPQDKMVSLKLRNGGTKSLQLELSEDDGVGVIMPTLGGVLAGQNRTYVLADRWANAINLQISKSRTVGANGSVRICTKCRKEVNQGSFTYCPFCGKAL